MFAVRSHFVGQLGRSKVAGLLIATVALLLGRRGVAQTTSPPLVPASPAAPTATPLSPGRLVGPIVELRADDPRIALQAKTDSDNWRDVCLTPCQSAVDPSRVYRVGGRHFVPSDPFDLPRNAGHVTIDAHLGSRAPNLVGKILTPVGAGLTISGALIYWLGSQQPDSPKDSDVPLPSSRTVFHAYGVAFLLVGAGVAVAGAILWLGNTSTVDVR